jgi:hypothetical protein
LLRVVAENVVTDKRTDGQTHKPSTVILATHAHRGLISALNAAARQAYYPNLQAVAKQVSADTQMEQALIQHAFSGSFIDADN